jgi:hypothetical protein
MTLSDARSVHHDERNVIMTITEHPEIAPGPATTDPDRITEEPQPEVQRLRSTRTPRRHRRRLIAGAVLVSGIATVVAVSLDRSESTPQVERPRSVTERVPSGSPFDAPLEVRRVTERVPSGSPFDAPLEVRRVTGGRR